MASEVRDLAAARVRIENAYDPQLLRRAGQQLVELLYEHFQRMEASDGVVLHWRAPQENVALARQVLADGAAVDRDQLTAAFSERVRAMLDRGHNLHDPRYIGHQVPAPVPLGGLFDAVGSLTNQVMAIYDMGPWSTAVEWAMVEELGQRIGWQSGQFSGLVTHGGSLANLTALLTARNVALGDCWERGLPRTGLPPVLVVQSDAHYCVSRSAGIVGIGTDQVVRVGLGPSAAHGSPEARRLSA